MHRHNIGTKQPRNPGAPCLWPYVYHLGPMSRRFHIPKQHSAEEHQHFRDTILWRTCGILTMMSLPSSTLQTCFDGGDGKTQITCDASFSSHLSLNVRKTKAKTQTHACSVYLATDAFPGVVWTVEGTWILGLVTAGVCQGRQLEA